MKMPSSTKAGMMKSQPLICSLRSSFACAKECPVEAMQNDRVPSRGRVRRKGERDERPAPAVTYWICCLTCASMAAMASSTEPPLARAGGLRDDRRVDLVSEDAVVHGRNGSEPVGEVLPDRLAAEEVVARLVGLAFAGGERASRRRPGRRGSSGRSRRPCPRCRRGSRRRRPFPAEDARTYQLEPPEVGGVRGAFDVRELRDRGNAPLAGLVGVGLDGAGHPHAGIDRGDFARGEGAGDIRSSRRQACRCPVDCRSLDRSRAPP